MIRSKILTTASAVSGPESSVAELPDARQHLRLALGLIDRQARLVLEPPDFDGARHAHVQQPHELLVDDVDPPAQLLDTSGLQPPHILLYPRVEIRRRAGLGDDADERAADHRRIGPPADFAHVLRLRDAEPRAHRQVC